MWSVYHTLRVSKEYISAWNSFLEQSGCSVLPIFCQHVGQYVFIKRHHTTSETEHHKKPFDPTYEELNGICYVAGWGCKGITKEIEAFSPPHEKKKSLSLCILSFLSEEDDVP